MATVIPGRSLRPGAAVRADSPDGGVFRVRSGRTRGSGRTTLRPQKGGRFSALATRRGLWRVHFFAGAIVALPVLLLSVTGTAYLFRPQIEAWLERDLDRLAPVQTPVAMSEIVAAAVDAVPDARLHGLEVRSEPPTAPGRSSAVRVTVQSGRERYRVAVDPSDASVLDVVAENERPMRVVRRLHGQWGLGPRGSYLVELTAGWTIVMVVTGLAIWIPDRRRRDGWAGVLYPRLRHGTRAAVRDMHGVVGTAAAAGIVFLIATGLPWSRFWGDYFRSIRGVVGSVTVASDWDNGSAGVRQNSRPASMRPAPSADGYGMDDVDAVATYASTLDWLPPVVVRPPGERGGAWSIASETADRPRRRSVAFDPSSGETVGSRSFADRPAIDRAVGYGIALHEGQFGRGGALGRVNTAVVLAITMSLVGLVTSGAWLSSRRGFRAPMFSEDAVVSPRRRWAVGATLLLLAVYLPLFGASAVVVSAVVKVGRLGRCRSARPEAPTPTRSSRRTGGFRFGPTRRGWLGRRRRSPRKLASPRRPCRTIRFRWSGTPGGGPDR